MVAWSIELSDFGIKYEPRGTIKAQSFTNFIVELLATTTSKKKHGYYMHMDHLTKRKAKHG